MLAKMVEREEEENGMGMDGIGRDGSRVPEEVFEGGRRGTQDVSESESEDAAASFHMCK